MQRSASSGWWLVACVGLSIGLAAGVASEARAQAQMQPAAGAAPAPDTAMTAAELLAALQAMGVELPEGVAVAEDGSVRLPAASAEAAAMAPAVNEAAAQAAAAATEPAAEEDLPELDPEWKQRIEIAFSLDDGNTESTNLRAAYRADRERDFDKLSFRAAYRNETDDGSTTKNEFQATGTYDRDIADTPWLWFVNGRYEWDQFESWDHRVGLTAGLGYRLIDREDMELILRAGGGFTREFGSGRNELIPEGLLGYDFQWDLDDRQGIESTFRYYPDLSELGEFRTVTTLGWRYALDVKDGLNLTAGLEHEYQSDVDPGVEESDLSLFAGLGLDF